MNSMIVSKRVLHIGSSDKFIPPFIEMVREHFEFSEHEFMLKPGMAHDQLQSHENIKSMGRGKYKIIQHYLAMAVKMQFADKIVLHGLFDPGAIRLLWAMPWLLRKCYWIIWGGDLYRHQKVDNDRKLKKQESFRGPVIKNMGYLVTGTPGDVALARKWYGATGQHIRCFNYPSNIYKEYRVPEKKHSGINILVGNSADPSNNHFEVFDKLEEFKGHDIRVYVPLSYGDQGYAKQVIRDGKSRFGDKFEPLTEMMPFEQYLEFLGAIDIAIFNHRRQQAFGNIITLLGLGKKVHMRPEVTSWKALRELDLHVFDVENLGIALLPRKQAEENMRLVNKYFSKSNLIEQLTGIFGNNATYNLD